MGSQLPKEVHTELPRMGRLTYRCLCLACHCAFLALLSTGRGRVQGKWVQPENVMFAQRLARSRPSGKIRQDPAKSFKSGKIRLYPLRLYPPKTHWSF